MAEIRLPDHVPGSEFCMEFPQLMANRMAVSYSKYGPVKEGFPDKVDALETLEVRLRQYRDTGNLDYLVDVANYAMIEFMLPAHPQAHRDSGDGGGNVSPGRFARNHPDTLTQEPNKNLELKGD